MSVISMVCHSMHMTYLTQPPRTRLPQLSALPRSGTEILRQWLGLQSSQPGLLSSLIPRPSPAGLTVVVASSADIIMCRADEDETRRELATLSEGISQVRFLGGCIHRHASRIESLPACAPAPVLAPVPVPYSLLTSSTHLADCTYELHVTYLQS